MVTSEDGLSFLPKRVVLKPGNYPDTCTNHVRDPKVWGQDGVLRMLLGACERDVAAGYTRVRASRATRRDTWKTRRPCLLRWSDQKHRQTLPHP
ncbi:hypothetical protein [Lancefieldella parvula]|uniref:hypothetical protein n=1 Tax=Lancefieldella parvula TaxID=1382 RepID=UPI00360959B2